MHPDGTGRSKLISGPIIEVQSVSPGRRWLIAIAPAPDGKSELMQAIAADGGSRQIIAGFYCSPVWSPNGQFLFVPVEEATSSNPGRSLAIPLGPDEALPPLPAAGIPHNAEAHMFPGAESVNRSDFIPGNNLSDYALVKENLHANLYRITMP